MFRSVSRLAAVGALSTGGALALAMPSRTAATEHAAKEKKSLLDPQQFRSFEVRPRQAPPLVVGPLILDPASHVTS
jgi:hypothetical protein